MYNIKSLKVNGSLMNRVASNSINTHVACKLMTTIITITTLTLSLSFFWLFKKPKTRLLEKYLTIIHFSFLGLTIFTLIILFQGFRFVGQYTNSIIGLTCLISGILLFGLTKSKTIKLYSGLYVIPTLVTEVSLLLGSYSLLLPAFMVYMMFAAPLEKEKVNGKYNLEIHQGGIMSPPNLFYLTKRTFFIFDEQIHLMSGEHFSDISKLEIVDFNENENVVCKIFTQPNNFTIDTLQYIK